MTEQALEATANEPPKTADDAFSEAFASLTLPEGATPAAKVEPAAAEVQPAGEDQTNFENPDAAAGEATKVADAAAAAAAEAAKAPAQPTLGDDFADKLAQAFVKAAPKPVEQVQQPQPQVQHLFSPDEAAFLSEYDKDYPDVARAEALRRRAENRVVVQHVFNEIGKVIGPLQEMLNDLMSDQQLAQITQAVPEYETKREDVVKWVEKQPTYLKIAYNHVIQNGTVEEITDLIGRYNQATGTAAPKAAVQAQATELPEATKKAAASLAPIGSKRTVVVQGIDKSDFDGAFAEAAKMV